jgi:hypothetical protein
MSVVALIGLCVSGVDGRQQARDAGLEPTIGTASISGVVVTDEAQPRPVRRAVVTLTGSELRPKRGAITDDDGRFVIGGLPAGRFTLTAARAGFVTSAYGAKRPARPGTPVVVPDGGSVADMVVRLWRGAAVSGILRDRQARRSKTSRSPPCRRGGRRRARCSRSATTARRATIKASTGSSASSRARM